MRARYKGPAGTGTLSLNDDATVGDLFDQIREKSGVDKFSLKYGWPLKTLEDHRKDEPAKALGLNGETFTIVPEESASLAAAAPEPAQPKASAPASSVSFGGIGETPDRSSFGNPQPPKRGPEGVAVPWSEREGTIVLRVMPDDNSCLFTAFGGALPNQLPVPQLRKMIADYVLSHQDEYNEAILSMPPHEYAAKIQDMDRWGGAIELSIFSELFDMQIYTLDVKDQTPYQFGEDKELRCILVYSGIHYDRVAFSPSEPPYTETDLPPELDRTIWLTADEAVLEKARGLIAQLNQMHYYTDPGEILLRCNVPGCDWMGSGQHAGAEHAKRTGHTALSEIEDDGLLKCSTLGCDWLGSGEVEAKKHTSDTGHAHLSIIPDL